MTPPTVRADILGKLLLIQETLDVLPDNEGIAAFLRRALSEIPGVVDIHLYIGGEVFPPSEAFDEVCAEYEAARNTSSAFADCIVGAAHAVFVPLRTARQLYGMLIPSLDDVEAFSPYRAFVQNIANVIATTLDTREYIRQLDEANKELEAFSYSISHDLRSPLRAIDGFSRILLDDYADKLDDEGKRLLNVVRNNTVRMGQLIDDLLNFSRASRLEISFSEIDMERLTHLVVEELQPFVAGRKLQVEIEPLPPFIGDRAMMHQVFVNLLSNAIKFSRYNEAAMIKVGSSIKGDEAVYFVQDNGAGFDMKYVDKLFGVFQRLHGMDEFEGTGIGLAIVKRVLTRHGGRVWAEGKVGEGATIYFALPII